MILQASHSHLYPGHRGRVSGLTRVSEIKAGNQCLVEFSEGSAVPARLSKCENGWHLDTGAYRTAAGTDIAEKRWLVALTEEAGEVEFRILRKVDFTQ